jgi:hypothetical protein
LAEIIEEGLEAVTTNKKMKKFLPFIVVGLGIGFIAYIKKSQSASTTDNTPVDDTGVNGNISGVMADDTNQKINDAISSNNDQIESAFQQVASKLDYADQRYSAVYDTVTQLSQDMNSLKNNPALQEDKSDVVTPDKSIPISAQVATNSHSVNGLFASQTFLEDEIDDSDQKKLDTNGAIWKASMDKANSLTAKAKSTTDKKKQAELLKQASSYKSIANQAHTDNETIRKKYDFSGGTSGNEYIKK